MKRSLMIFLAILTILGSLLTPSPALAANAVVGNGTSASCTETAFDNALTTVNTTGGGTITFNCGAAAHTITLTTQKVINLTNVTINGNNLIILNGSLGVRHFFAGNGVTLTLQKITLRNGDPLAGGGAIEINESTVILSEVEISNNYASTFGGAIYCYGASAGLVISNSLIANNSAATSGGALYNDGCPVNISGSTFLHNTATNAGGGIYNAAIGALTMGGTLLQDNEAMDGPGLYNAANAIASLAGVDFYSNSGGYGGGVENSGTFDITDSLFRENSVTGSGGGLWNLGGSANITRTTFRQNEAYEGAGINSYGSHLALDYVNLTDNISSGSGGGLYHGGGTAFLSNLTISSNQAVNGGGIYQSSDDNLMVTNATIANNSASMVGGGLYHYNRYAILTNVTIAHNVAPAGSAIYEDSPMDLNFPGIVQIVNSVILGSANNCDGGLFTSWGYNLSQGTCGALTHVTDLPNYPGPIYLGALANNGGLYPMQTMMPGAGSPLIDSGNNSHCPPTDQRGVSRPQKAQCDIGAYEVEGVIPSTWVGGVAIQSNQAVVAVARPHLGSQIASYIAPGAGSSTQYVPMLFKDAFAGGAYKSALYVQNLGAAPANLTIEFRNDAGTVVHTITESLAAKASKGYWLSSIAGLGSSFVGGAKVTSDQPVLAVGRPHIGPEVMTYNGMAAGSTTAWLPMFFKNGFGNYNTALYIQNVTVNSANLTIQYLNLDGTVACTDNDSLGANASKGYWSLAVTCDSGSLPMGFVGGVKVTSTQNILAVGRAHLGTQITTYNGFAGGATTTYVPMLFRNAFANGAYKAALYLQNVSGASANVTIEYVNDAGAVAATQNVTLASGAISSIWLPGVAGLPDGFVGGARISATQVVIAVGRPHLGAEITAYNGTSTGSLNAYLPMLFKNAYVAPYQAAFYIQNVTGNPATVDISFYDEAGTLSCVKSINLAANATQGFWMPTVNCGP